MRLLAIECAIGQVRAYHLQAGNSQQLDVVGGMQKDYYTRKAEGLLDFKLGVEKDLKSRLSVRLQFLQPDDLIIEGQLSEQLRVYRQRRNLTRVDAAKLTDLDASHIFRLETGAKMIGLHALAALVEAYGLSKQQTEGLIKAAGFPSDKFDFTNNPPRDWVCPAQSSIREAIGEKIKREAELKRIKQELLGWRLFGDYIKWAEKGLEDIAWPVGRFHQPTIEVASGSLGEQLVRYRKNLGLTCWNIARQIEIDPSYLFRIEKSERQPSEKILSRLVEILGLSDEQRQHLFLSRKTK